MNLFYSPLETAVRTALKHAPLLIFQPRHADRGVDPDIEERCDWHRTGVARPQGATIARIEIHSTRRPVGGLANAG